jgi:hypothetical protein
MRALLTCTLACCVLAGCLGEFGLPVASRSALCGSARADDVAMDLFTRETWPEVFSQRCIVCHNPSGIAKDSGMVFRTSDPGATFATIKALARDDGLLLRKPTGQTASHGGGTVIGADSPAAEMLARFVATVNGTGDLCSGVDSSTAPSAERAGPPPRNSASCVESGAPPPARVVRLSELELRRSMSALISGPIDFTIEPDTRHDGYSPGEHLFVSSGYAIALQAAADVAANARAPRSIRAASRATRPAKLARAS